MAMAIERLIETTVLVDLLRGYVPAREWLDSLPPGEAAISVITAAELLAGCRDRREQETVEDELAS
jgi:predicted nucleic acid-binding protein